MVLPITKSNADTNNTVRPNTKRSPSLRIAARRSTQTRSSCACCTFGISASFCRRASSAGLSTSFGVQHHARQRVLRQLFERLTQAGLLLELLKRLVATDVLGVRHTRQVLDVITQVLAIFGAGVEVQVQRNLRRTLPGTTQALDIIKKQRQTHRQAQCHGHHQAGEKAANRLLAQAAQAVEEAGAMAFDPGVQQRAEVRTVVLVALFLLRLRVGGFRRDTLGYFRAACCTHTPASPSPIRRPRCRVSMRWRMRAISARS